MSFRLRRGTDTERQSVVFAEGELVYTIDTKELYVGDGTTLGGIRITGAVSESPIALTQDLDMNGFDIIGSGDIDINGQITASAFYGNGSGLTNLPVLDVNNGAAYQISIMGADSSIIVNSDTSEVFGDFVGNLKGAVFDSSNNIMIDNVMRTMYGTLNGEFNGVSTGLFISADSSVMVNSDTSTFTGNFVGDAAGLTNFPPDIVVPGGDYSINIVGEDSSNIVNVATNSITANSVNANEIVTPDLQVTGNADTISSTIIANSSNTRSLVRLIRTTETDISDSVLLHGSIFFDRDDVNGPKTTSLILGGNDGVYIAGKKDGVFPESIYASVTSTGFGVGTFTPAEKLDVRGNAKVSGFVQFGSLTTTERNALTAANGMVIYNTTDNRFQGYQNGAWINLDDGTSAP